jgi:hypothetical protein
VFEKEAFRRIFGPMRVKVKRGKGDGSKSFLIMKILWRSK